MSCKMSVMRFGGLKWIVVGAVAVALLLPLTVAAATNTEIIAIMKEVITGVIQAGRDAYCASGVTALCP